jgi:Icc-related predicted phosphoesterase
MDVCRCGFVSDLHGRPGHYRTLAAVAREEELDVVLVGGDLLPAGDRFGGRDFVREVLVPTFEGISRRVDRPPPRVLLIPGNDDPLVRIRDLGEGEARGLWTLLHERTVDVGRYRFTGYACVPPTPFGLKDWERYDVSRSIDPGCVPPEAGWRSVPVDPDEISRTIAEDLARLGGAESLENTVLLCHSPPYQSVLDRAALDGVKVDHAPVDVHVGSVALARFIADRQPLVTLHGHIHESVRLTGSWRQRIGRTHLFGAAHDGPELALVRFDLADLDGATRELVPVED